MTAPRKSSRKKPIDVSRRPFGGAIPIVASEVCPFCEEQIDIDEIHISHRPRGSWVEDCLVMKGIARAPR